MNALPSLHLVASPWVADLLTHLWQSTAVALAILLLLIIGRRLSARTRRTLGWIAVAKFVLPAAWLVALAGRVFGPARGTMVANAVPWSGDPALTASGAAAALNAWAPPAWLWPWLGGVWAAVAVGLLARWVLRGVRVRRELLARARPVDETVACAVAAAAARAGLRPAPRCVEVDWDHGPGALGILSPVLILPRGLMEAIAPAERAAILIHECVHVRQHDNFWSAVRALFVGVLWFNPIAWLLNRAIAIETEKSCDERVLQITGDAENYASGIVASVRHTLGVMRPGFAAATTPPVVARLQNILAYPARQDRPALRWTAVALALGLAALGGRAGSIAATAPVAPAASDEAVANSSEIAADFLRRQVDRLQREADVAGSPEEAAGKAAERAQLLRRLKDVESIRSRVSEGAVRVAQAAPATPTQPAPAKPSYKIGTITITFVSPASIGEADVRAVMQMREGGEFDETSLDRDIRAIYRMGVFKFVEVKHTPVDGSTFNLVVELTPRPAVGLLRAPDVELTKANAAAGPLVLSGSATATHGVTFDVPVRPAPPTAPGFSTPSSVETELIEARRLLAETSAELKRLRDERAAAVAKEHEAAEALARAVASKKMPPAATTPAPLTATPASPEKSELRPTPALTIAASVPRIETAAVFRGMKVFAISELDQAPVARFQARPQYPFEMRRQKIGGEAVVDFIIDTNGEVVNAYAIRSSRVEFEAPAVQAVSKWKFKPGRKGGRDVPTHMQVPIVFTLNE